MHIVTRKRLIDFAVTHPKARRPLLAWFNAMRAARFASHHDMKEVFGSADVIAGKRVVFDVGGNKYRIVADMIYEMGRVFIRAVLTHAQYDEIDVRDLQKPVREGNPMATARLDFSRPHVLRDGREYNAAVAEIDAILDRDPEAGTDDYDRLEFLSVLVVAFEEEHYPIKKSAPQEVVDLLLEQQGMTRAQLSAVLGGRSRVSDFFSGKRDLSINQARSLRDLFGVPIDLFV